MVRSGVDPSDIGRAMNALRKHRGGGGSKRRVAHDPTVRRCLCIDCRKARGQYPAHLMAEKPAKTRAKRPKRA